MVILSHKSSDQAVVWIGSECATTTTFERLANKDVHFYKKCIYESMIIAIGNYVLIKNADSTDPDSDDGCDIAKILHLYELNDIETKKDKSRAIVQWYSRPQAIPQKHFDSDSLCIDFCCEIVEEHRPYDTDVSIETIFKKCSVLTGESTQTAAQLISTSKFKNVPMFVCRYKFIKIKGSYKLLPLEYMPENGRTPKSAAKAKSKATPLRERSSNKQQEFTAVEFVECLANTEEKSHFLPEETVCPITYEQKEIQSTVSPIKIVGNVVVRLARMSDKKEINSNYLTNSPRDNESTTKLGCGTPLYKVIAARRNLNISLDSTTDSDVLNYSIIKEGDKTPSGEMKIKLRLSEKQQVTPASRLTRRQSRLLDDEDSQQLQGTPSRKSERKRSVSDGSSVTPLKKTKSQVAEMSTPKGRLMERRKSILKTPGSKSAVGTPKRNIQLSNIVEERVFHNEEIISTPKRGKGAQRTPKRLSVKKMLSPEQPMTPSQRLKLIRSGGIAPTIDKRVDSSASKKKTDLQLTREKLHVSAIPQSLPCRENEFDNIYSFLEGKIQDQCGGCMYVSGVPGTGKTATVTGVIRMLKQQAEKDEILPFEFIEINGMRLTEPRQAYVEIFKKLTGKTVSWEHAHTLLEKRFTTPAPHRTTTVLLVDELDILCNRRQDVVYNLLDWPTKSAARLVVITIANTMDLPERLLMGKVTSRLGLTRLTFQPYTHKQLQEIVTTRLCGSDSFKSDAVQLVARKVAAVSGDARRALDICRRATEIAEAGAAKEQVVSMLHVQQALAEMIASAKVQAIKSCSRLEQVFLQAVIAEVNRTGVEETNFLNVYTQIETIAAFMGLPTPTPGRALKICSKLGAERLLISEHSRTDVFQKIILNVSMDDIHYALQVNN